MVGRALGLIIRNLGRAVLGVIDMATMGQPAKFGLCFAENEEASPWEPFHVERGFHKEQSTVTLIAIAGTTEVVNSFEQDADELMASLALTLAAPSSIALGHNSVSVGGGQPVILMSPEWAQICRRQGLTKSEVKERIWQLAVCSTTILPPRQQEAVRLRQRELRRHELSSLHVSATPNDIILLIAGGVGVKQTIMPTWNGGTSAVTVGIDMQIALSRPEP